MNLTGRVLGKYKLTERLGQGGMAQVYKAVQPTIERPVAIKILHAHLAESGDFVTRFKREARGLGQLQHPHIVQVIDFDVEEDIYYMVVDYIPGRTLRDYLDEQGALAYSTALDITAQIADALDYAHKKGTIHRDIKPGNVIFKDEAANYVVLTDFGIGRLIDDATMTMSGSIIGTPAYMSPEAVLGQRVDGRTDIYSLGIILYEMVTAHVPYAGNTPMSVIMKQVNEPLPSPLELRPDLPGDILHLIEKALAKNADDRFQTAGEFLDAIRATQANLSLPNSATYRTRFVPETGETSVTPVGKLASVSPLPTAAGPTATGPMPSAADSASPSRKRWPLFVAIGLVVLALLAGGIWFSNANTGRLAGGGVAAVATDSPTATVADPTPSVELSPTTATLAPTQTSAATSVAPPPPTTEPIAEGVPAMLPGQMGSLYLDDSETARAGSFTMQIDRVLLPPAGSHYELWVQVAGGDLRNLGTLPVTQNQILFSGNLDQALVGPGSGIVISIEPDGMESLQATSPGGTVAYIGQLPDTYAGEMQQLLVDAGNGTGVMIGAQEQALLATQHAQFSLEALDANNLVEAKQHAEHVVNILDGESGQFFGDVNLDNQTQNPGDGFGVRSYLTESTRHIQQAFNSVDPTTDREYYTGRAVAANRNSLDTLDEAIQTALRIIATDTADEARPFAQQLRGQVQTLLFGTTDRETIQASYRHTLALATIPLMSRQGLVDSPDGIADSDSGRIGLLRLGNNQQARGGDFLLQITRMPSPGPDNHYDVWLINDMNQNARKFVGELNLTNHYGSLAGSQNQNLLADYNRIVVTVEDTSFNIIPSDTVAFQGELLSEIGIEATRLLTAENEQDKGVLFGAEEQLRVAQQHRQFAQEGLAAGNLAEAKVHTEHVINILDGEEGEHFGDLNFDGQAQNPGDGVGVRGYLQNTIAAVETLQQDFTLSGNQQFFVEQIIATSNNSLATTEAAIEQALKIFAADTAEEAQPFLNELERLLNDNLNGSDRDGNGVVDPLQGESGIVGMNGFVLALNEVAIVPFEGSPLAQTVFFNLAPGYFSQLTDSHRVVAMPTRFELPADFFVCEFHPAEEE